MGYTKKEVIRFVQENDVKFIRLAFCDIFGVQKNISIMPKELQRAFDDGIAFDASFINGFMNIERSDLFLFPDPSTMSILPWRPQTGRVVRFFCDIKYPDGKDFEGDGRKILIEKTNELQALGYQVEIGTECEFYLFQMDEFGNPTKIPYDEACYFDIAPKDKAENVRRDICLTLEQMGIMPETSHHQHGPGQNMIVYKASDPLTAADNLVTFKSVVKTIAQKNGLYATFMPKPLAGKSGNGFHINISLKKNDMNLFDPKVLQSNKDAYSFAAGIMARMRDMTLFLNSTINSYERIGKFEAPKFVTWSYENQGHMIRILSNRPASAMMELRSSDSTANPYLALTLILSAGIEGLIAKAELQPATDLNLFHDTEVNGDTYIQIPNDLNEAITVAKQSDFIEKTLPKNIIDKFIETKEEEWLDYSEADDKNAFEEMLYFYQL